MMFSFFALSFLLAQTSYIVEAQFDCIETCYSGLLAPKKEHIYPNKFIKGYSYKNITNIDYRKCYSICKQDCRCKACQMKDARCELLDGDTKFCNLHLHNGPGYVFYDLEQTQFQGQSHMIQPNVCYNGCCQSQPCQNGGTCHENCQDPKQKFTCHCKEMYTGTVCERKVSSCQEIAKNVGTLSHGLYTIYRLDTGAALTVYCDFTTQNEAWTLIESFSYSQNDIYRNYPFYSNFSKNVESKPMVWGDYRLPLDNMKYLISVSKKFRATCQFPNRTGGSLKRDSLIGSLKEYDIINDGEYVGCKTYEYINIRGKEYFNQSAYTYHRSAQHYHVEPLDDDQCGFNDVPGEIKDEEFFGVYDPRNPTFSCVEDSTASTQWWLGGRLQKCP